MDKRKMRRLLTQALYSVERRDMDNARSVLQAALDLTVDEPDENTADDERPALLMAQAD